MPHPISRPSGVPSFLTGVRWCIILYKSKMAATFESVFVVRLRDVQELTKTYLDAWKSGKVCCSHNDCYSKNVLSCSD